MLRLTRSQARNTTVQTTVGGSLLQWCLPKQLQNAASPAAQRFDKLLQLQQVQNRFASAKATNPKDKKRTDISRIEFVNETPSGQKKDMNKPMLDAYHPEAVEAAWYDWWEQQGFFAASNDPSDSREKFVIMLPPPNVTGTLHLGHALTVSIQDALVRWHRMNGKNCLYLPGVDHAGIATQVVVEKRLMKETGQTRHDLGREAFLEKVWEWKDQYAGRIRSQLRRTGASLDWTREAFTMDEQRSKAVTEAFVLMFEKGLIYRDNRMVNWDCVLRTAISNIEVDYMELEKPIRMSVPGHDSKKKYDFGWLWSFAYKVDGSDEELVVSTTRPETMLGDTAVAVHPDDARYKHLHGKFLLHPFNGRRIPIVLDAELVNMEFGTGAVKVTPAHDPNDFKCGKKHDLEFINIFCDDGTLNANAGSKFAGLKRFDARDQVLQALEALGLYRGRQPNRMSIGICSRSGDVIEPIIKPQWFVSMDELASKALDATEKGELKIHPQREEKTWQHWLQNMQPWCISRQLWWGHRIPAYFVSLEGGDTRRQTEEENPDAWIVARSEQEALEKARQKFGNRKFTLHQDEDVLDTWFSSGLFPFSTLGWPDASSADLKAFYPGHLLETGMDILFFWVARMVMMGYALMDKLPFSSVLLHAMVRDKFGEKMSKSKGNVIDPIDCIEGITLDDLHSRLLSYNLSTDEAEKSKQVQRLQFPDGIPQCGTDALRFTLLNYTSHGRDINMDIMRVFGYRTFCNKLWNATKFCLMNFEGFSLAKDDLLPAYEDLSFGDKWILSRLNACISECDAAFKDYDFSRYTESCYNFFLRELCDVYLEWIKPTMNADRSNLAAARARQSAQHTLYVCLEQGFRLLHPAMPFLTEELWHRLPARQTVPHERRSIMLNPYPTRNKEWSNDNIETSMQLCLNIVSKVRSIKAANQLTNKQRPEVFVQSGDAALLELVKQRREDISNLCFVGNVHLARAGETIPAGCESEALDGADGRVFVMLKGMVDYAEQSQKLQKQKERVQQGIDNLLKKTQGPGYAEKVPQHVREQDSTKLEQLRADMAKLDDAIHKLQDLK